MYTCEYCNKNFETKQGVLNHMVKKHNKTFNSYDERYKFYYYILDNKEIPKCKYCDNDIYVNTKKGSKVCNNKECKFKYNSDIHKKVYKDKPELILKAKENRLKYLSNKENFNSTAFGKRCNKKLSFLEKWFYDNVIIKYNLTNKYLIINEYKIKTEDKNSAYSLDFAFINIKLDVELDGRCHFINGKERQKHDIKRDNFLLKNNWNIYRISFYDVEKNEEETINKFINILQNNSFKYDNSYYLRNKVITNKEFIKQYNRKKDKEYNKKLKQIEKEKYYNEQYNLLKDLEENSNINFKKFGWVKQANDYLLSKGKSIKLLHRYIKKYYPDFFKNTGAFIRKTGS